MENQEEIEEFYKKKTEELDKQFLENLRDPQKKLSSGEIEKNYKKNLSLIKQKYEEKYASYLQEQKNNIIKKKKDSKTKREKQKEERFIVKPLNLELTKKERFFMKWELFWFKFKIKKILRRKIPDSWRIFYLKIKLKIKNFFVLRKNLTEKDYQKTKTKSITIATDLKNKTLGISKKIFYKLKKILTFLLEKIKSIKKKKTEEGDKKEKHPEEEIVQKILKKSG
jgi:hypothetical protein